MAQASFRHKFMKENEIRPRDLFQKYLDLSKADAAGMPTDKFEQVACPGCQANDARVRLEKEGFRYQLCNQCGSLYCSPRPSQQQLEKFYKNSTSSEFWAREFFPTVAEARRVKIFRSKAERVAEILKQRQFQPEHICDVGAGYGIFLEELQASLHSVDQSATYYAIEPSPDLAAICRSKNFATLEATVEHAREWSGRFDLVICSEVIEHVYSTDLFLESILSLLRPGGMAILTGLGYEGLDILELQEHSNSISPPHHINFMSVVGFEKLFTRCGCRDVAVQTPGQLDVDILLNSEHCPHWLEVLARRGEVALQDLQNLLRKHRLSSHVWALGIKN